MAPRSSRSRIVPSLPVKFVLRDSHIEAGQAGAPPET
jgi:hypothetical protein